MHQHNGRHGAKSLSLLACAIFATTLLGCGSPSPAPKEKTTAPAEEPKPALQCTFEAPTTTTEWRAGEKLPVRFRLEGNVPIDSCLLWWGDRRLGKVTRGDTLLRPDGLPVGVQYLRVVAHAGQSAQEWSRRVTLFPPKPARYTYRRIASYPHDPKAYTQGLLYLEGALYESTGQRGHSSLRKVELASGKVLQSTPLPDQLFGEGLALRQGMLYQLTWTAGKCLVYSLASLQQVDQLSYPGQGWGLESDGDFLYRTDGSEWLYLVEPDHFTTTRSLQVFNDQGPQPMLNELEFIDGLLYANVYMEDRIVAIDPNTGAVVRDIDMAHLLQAPDRTPEAEVLNGIAYDKQHGAIYLTGKYWPRLFQVQFVAK